MRILGIETSCDETAAAVVENGMKILSSVIASSAEMHVKSGGIIPEQAARQQIKSIIPVIEEALYKGIDWKPSDKSIPNIDAIAVTVGPGLIGSLLVGVETAKTLSRVWKKPVVPVNHLIAHIYANWLDVDKIKSDKPKFPALALVVSGGHTELVFIKGHGKIKWIGGTRDDAAGEAFDKTARLLKLPYPGGPSISREAQKYFRKRKKGQIKLNLFPRPLINSNTIDWSFSGLKTSVSNYLINNNTKKYSNSRIVAEVQEAIIDILINKTMLGFQKHKPRSLLLAGGVSANSRLRKKFFSRNLSEILQVLHVSDVRFCTDNAAMVSSCAFYNFKPISWQQINALPGLTISDAG
jgi:N6-L-threonylcarbamoyladenine synthase